LEVRRLVLHCLEDPPHFSSGKAFFHIVRQNRLRVRTRFYAMGWIVGDGECTLRNRDVEERVQLGEVLRDIVGL
jgi:hypothetical protein